MFDQGTMLIVLFFADVAIRAVSFQPVKDKDLVLYRIHRWLGQGFQLFSDGHKHSKVQHRIELPVQSLPHCRHLASERTVRSELSFLFVG